MLLRVRVRVSWRVRVARLGPVLVEQAPELRNAPAYLFAVKVFFGYHHVRVVWLLLLLKLLLLKLLLEHMVVRRCLVESVLWQLESIS
jgi:hypothetical protein